MFGGVGLRRGRRDPDHLRVGDALDFWRVEQTEQEFKIARQISHPSVCRVYDIGEADGKVSLIQAYYGQLHDRIKAFYTVPAIISEAERRRLVAVVVIYVAQDGAILKHELEQESGNDAFDAALEAALQRASPLPAPPVFLRDQLREGVALRFRP